MQRDWLLGFPPVLLALGDEPRKCFVTPPRVRELAPTFVLDSRSMTSDKPPAEATEAAPPPAETKTAPAPDADGWIAWDPHAGVNEAPEGVVFAKLMDGAVLPVDAIVSWGRSPTGYECRSVIAYRTTPLPAAKE